MSLRVQHLNADSTFLLTFRPAFEFPPTPGTNPGTFSILVDPWLHGISAVFSPHFSSQRHTSPSSIAHLDEIPEPDVVIISQDKPDHCHEATLRQLRPDCMNSTILAEPAAAKRIRSWRHFSPDQVKSMERFDEKRPSRVLRYPVPAFSPFGKPGEVTIAFITNNRDLTGMHNAVGITYRPPRAPVVNFSHPMTPKSNSSGSGSSTSSLVAPQDRTISVIYSPHGVCYPYIKPYASSHLVSEAALPLTALLHPFDRVENPWFLGGKISLGLPGGLQIAQDLLARYWISAHDEEKELGGVTAASVRTQRFTQQKVEEMLTDERGRKYVEVVVLDVGQDMSLP